MSIFYDGDIDITGGADGINVRLGEEISYLDGSKVGELLEKLGQWHKDMVEAGDRCRPEEPNY